MERFKWCFIGTGTLAGNAAGEITPSGRHQIASVVSRKLENAEAFAGKFGGEAFADAETAVKKADAVYVVTPHPSHYAAVKTALEAGIPVLCEKPLTVRAEETKELFRLAREKQIYLAEGMWTWFAPVARKVKEWTDALGEIHRVTTNYRVNVLNYAPRLTDPRLAGGAILDSGVYPITYLYRLFGKPVAVKCTGTIVNGVDLSDEIDLTFRNGKTFSIALSISDDAGVEDLRIEGEKGEIFVDHFHYADRATMTTPQGTEIFEAKTTLLNEFDRVAEEIRAGKTESEYVPAEATIDVMELMDECRRQIGLVYPFEK